MSRVARSDTRRRLVVVILHLSADARSVRLGWVLELTGQKNCRHSRTKSALSSLICRATIHSHSYPPFVLPTPGYSDDRYGADSVNTAHDFDGLYLLRSGHRSGIANFPFRADSGFICRWEARWPRCAAARRLAWRT